MAIDRLTISYPDFVLNTIIDPDQIDTNNLEILTKVNENIDQENVNTTKLAIQDTNIANTIISVASANTKSDTANTKADGAIVTADSANTKATNAVSTANSASTSASGAVTIATDAKNKAIAVEADYNAVKPQLLQAVIDVASKVDKSYVDQVALNYQNGVMLDKSITSSKLSDAVNTSISEKALNSDLVTLQNTVAGLTSTATGTSVIDVGNYFTSTNAEGSLQEIGLVLNNMRGNLITTTNAILGM